MKKIIFIFISILYLFQSCISEEEKIIKQWNVIHDRFTVLMSKDSLPWLNEVVLDMEHIANRYNHSFYGDEEKDYSDRENYIKEIKPIRDSISLLEAQLDSLQNLIEDSSHFIYFWSDKPYKNIFDKINKSYRIKQYSESNFHLISRTTNEEIEWNMEDVNNLKNIIYSVLKFDPEKTDRYGTLLYTCRDYNLEIYYTGNKTLIIYIKEK